MLKFLFISILYAIDIQHTAPYHSDGNQRTPKSELFALVSYDASIYSDLGENNI